MPFVPGMYVSHVRIALPAFSCMSTKIYPRGVACIRILTSSSYRHIHFHHTALFFLRPKAASRPRFRTGDSSSGVRAAHGDRCGDYARWHSTNSGYSVLYFISYHTKHEVVGINFLLERGCFDGLSSTWQMTAPELCTNVFQAVRSPSP